MPPKRKGAMSCIVAGMVAGKALTEIAVEAGVSTRTLRRRLREPDMIARVAEAQTEVQRELLGRLGTLGGQALDTLTNQMKSEDPAIQLRAAKVTLERLIAHQNAFESQRIQALELRVAANDAAEDRLREGGSWR